ncbi:MAG: hypothetical protein H9897_00070 [Candidatus Ureaplasma intestinipullorum]|uniref:ECF transporter S component n=1 Tax=Candidatus Ureaplasma intestinipullorum TaxID=2838770 RepID=A0A9E2KUT4_9BACT|nr:hypothetical protein [Candidatus Ureaplasma intestinipullorum]
MAFIKNPLFIFIAFLIALLVASIIKKIYYRLRYKKRFYILPKVGIKGIASVAMVIAISISIIIFLTVITADIMGVVFRAWPGTRITIEGILIKIGGLLFGPFLGMFIGALTDLLSVSLTAGVFHYGYLVASMAFGLISGLISEIYMNARRKNIQAAVWSTIILVFADILVILYLFLDLGKNDINIEFLGLNIDVAPNLLIGIIAGFIVFGVLVIWIGLYFYNKRIKTNNTLLTQRQIINKKTWYLNFSMILTCSIVTDALINVLMMPKFDAELSSLLYEQWIAIRGVLFIPEVVLNMLIIFPIFKIVTPLINYNYHEDLVEDKNIPVYVD